MSDRLRRLVTDGLLAPGAAAEVVERFGVQGSRDAQRVLCTRVLGGFEADVVASRGLDIGHVSWHGLPVSWRSPVEDARALDAPRGTDWLGRFTGGLLTTCGPFHIGAAAAAHGLHGDLSHRPAGEITVTRGTEGVRISGTTQARTLFGPSVDVRRTIESTLVDDGARLRIVDEINNVGAVDAPVAMLYHLNIGAPIAVPGSLVEVDADAVVPSAQVADVPDPRVLPEAVDHVVEAVFAHVGVRTDADGWARATVRPPSADVEVELAWHADTLPHTYQWVLPVRGAWALAIEPASAPLFAHDAAIAPSTPTLRPGETRRHEIVVTIRAIVV